MNGKDDDGTVLINADICRAVVESDLQRFKAARERFYFAVPELTEEQKIAHEKLLKSLERRVSARAFGQWEGYNIEARVDKTRRKKAPYDLIVWIGNEDDGDDECPATLLQISVRLEATNLKAALEEARDRGAYKLSKLGDVFAAMEWK